MTYFIKKVIQLHFVKLENNTSGQIEYGGQKDWVTADIIQDKNMQLWTACTLTHNKALCIVFSGLWTNWSFWSDPVTVHHVRVDQSQHAGVSILHIPLREVWAEMTNGTYCFSFFL